MREIVEAAKNWAIQEIEKYGPPYLIPLEIAGQKALQLCKRLKADENVVLLGTYLMDISLGRCVVENRMADHVAEGANEAKKFLSNYDIAEADKAKILNCIEAHHGAVPVQSLEAEICVNADCYKFLTAKGVFFFLTAWSARGEDYRSCIGMLEQKLEEKNAMLTLDICKQELEQNYQLFRKLVAEATE